MILRALFLAFLNLYLWANPNVASETTGAKASRKDSATHGKFQELREHNSEEDAQDSNITWEEVIRCDPGTGEISPQDRIASLYAQRLKIIQKYGPPDGPYTIPEMDNLKRILPIEQKIYESFQKLFDLQKDAVSKEDIESYWDCCLALEKFDEAYNVALMLMDDYGVTFDEFEENYQMENVVTTFSHFANVESRKFKCLQSFLMERKGENYIHLIILYTKRKMYPQLVALYESHQSDLLDQTDIDFFLGNFIAACLYTQKYDLALQILEQICDQNEKFTLRPLIYMAMGDKDKTETAITNFNIHLQTTSHQTTLPQQTLRTCYLKLFKKDIEGGLRALARNTGQPMALRFIYLKEKTRAPESEVQDLKGLYQESFKIPYRHRTFHFLDLVMYVLQQSGTLKA